MQNIYMPTKCELLKIDKLQEKEWLFTLRYEGSSKPGQFMQLSLPKAGECPISITKHNEESSEIEFLIRKIGRVTDKIFELKVGDYLYLRGPFGTSFDFEHYKNKNVIVIAGGSGLAPVRPIINEFYTDDKFKLLVGCRNKEGLLFKSDLEKWSSTNKNIHVTLDDNEGDENYLSGLVTQHFDMLFEGLDPLNTVVIVVGPPVMMHFATIDLKKFDIIDENIIVSFERNMSCAVGKCGHCKIDETYICLEGPVFNYEKAKYLLD